MFSDGMQYVSGSFSGCVIGGVTGYGTYVLRWRAQHAVHTADVVVAIPDARITSAEVSVPERTVLFETQVVPWLGLGTSSSTTLGGMVTGAGTETVLGTRKGVMATLRGIKQGDTVVVTATVVLDVTPWGRVVVPTVVGRTPLPLVITMSLRAGPGSAPAKWVCGAGGHPAPDRYLDAASIQFDADTTAGMSALALDFVLDAPLSARTVTVFRCLGASAAGSRMAVVCLDGSKLPFTTVPGSATTVFLIMHGGGEEKTAAKAAVLSLPDAVLLQILTMDPCPRAFSAAGPKRLTDDVRYAAIEFLDGQRAAVSGCFMTTCVETVAKYATTRRSSERTVGLVFASNTACAAEEHHVLDTALLHAKDAYVSARVRFHVAGAGTDAHFHRLAAATCGLRIPAVEEAAATFVAAASRPVLTNIKATWGGFADDAPPIASTTDPGEGDSSRSCFASGPATMCADEGSLFFLTRPVDTPVQCLHLTGYLGGFFEGHRVQWTFAVDGEVDRVPGAGLVTDTDTATDTATDTDILKVTLPQVVFREAVVARMCAMDSEPENCLALSLRHRVPNGRQTVMVLADSKSWVVGARMVTPDIFWTSARWVSTVPSALRRRGFALLQPRQVFKQGLEAVGSGVGAAGAALGTVKTAVVEAVGGVVGSVLKRMNSRPWAKATDGGGGGDLPPIEQLHVLAKVLAAQTPQGSWNFEDVDGVVGFASPSPTPTPTPQVTTVRVVGWLNDTFGGCKPMWQNQADAAAEYLKSVE
jgi:hypothetical protein